MIIYNPIKKIIVLFLCSHVASYAILVERGKEQISTPKKIEFIPSIKSVPVIIEEESIYYNFPQGLTKKQISRRNKILHSQKLRLNIFLKKLKQKQYIDSIRNKRHYFHSFINNH